MKIIETKAGLSELIQALREENKTIGFVPTMGALHEGHLSLIEKSKAQCDVIVVSIFVNPTQFNNREDLKTYPRNFEKDRDMLLTAECDILFYPDESEMYPEDDERRFNFDELEQVMEGKFRPGHFNGVAQIVSKLFDTVQPDKAYFGQKDFQQLAIIKALVRMNKYDIEIVACPIIREADGLAMSSRNTRLSLLQRKNASVLSALLIEAKQMFENGSPVLQIKEMVARRLEDTEGALIDYFEIVDTDTLVSVSQESVSKGVTACVAAYFGDVRLIDNIIFF